MSAYCVLTVTAMHVPALGPFARKEKEPFGAVVGHYVDITTEYVTPYIVF